MKNVVLLAVIGTALVSWGASLTGALFVFQACYGIQQGPLFEHGQAPMDFTLVSHETGLPVAGIHSHDHGDL